MSSELEQIKKELEAERTLRQKAEEEKLQAEEEKKQAEDGRKQAEDRAKQTEENSRRTTFEEYLELCHGLTRAMTVETNPKLSTKGATTSPKGKTCPTNLKPWAEFHDIRQSAFDEIYQTFHPADGKKLQLFSSQGHIDELREDIARRKIASELDLRYSHSSAVENPVERIIDKIIANDPYQNFVFGQGVAFENHANTLNDLATDVQNLRISDHPTKPVYADQLCVRKEGDNTELLFVIEQKPPHKLTKKLLRTGLCPLNIPDQVINRKFIPTDPVEKFQYDAEKLVAAVATQTYTYMLQSGIEYGCIVTGEALVFLWIQADDPNTLHYHLAEPDEEVRGEEASDFQHPLTAVGQLLSFCLMASRSNPREQIWRDRATKNAQKWSEDWEKITHEILEEVKELEPPGSAYKVPSKYINNNPHSPYQLRKKKLRSDQSCAPNNKPIQDDRNDPDDDNDPDQGSGQGPESINTPSKVASARGSRRNNQQQDTRNSTNSGGQRRQYCTQKCFLGLVRGSALDDGCPNIESHRQGKNVRTHPIKKQHFATMVRQQLAGDLDYYVKNLKKQGSRGMLFQITLASHGYTFVGKGTRDVFVPDLKHEARMYDRLKCIQGKMIPVYLGNIDLIRPWRDLGVCIIHMLLMSWGGEEIRHVKAAKVSETEVDRFVGKIAELGVVHGDLERWNMLWSEETNGMMFIDFERAEAIPTTKIPTRALQEISVNRKRKRSGSDVEKGKYELGREDGGAVDYSPSQQVLA